ncbi:hypothetical protein [Cohnella hongkongensis]|uniref:Uncharacterized protein n=1 Tax=Cohnella hongkongensis TaxID=178337 RepID=A0ABV9FFN3_9BACL
MNRRARWLAAVACCALAMAVIAAVVNGGSKPVEASLAFVNSELQADGVRIGMPEPELIELWGPGRYQEGFGGHLRDYPDRKCYIGIPGDRDNDLFGAIGHMEISNPGYAVFGIRPGDSIESSRETLIARGFRPLDHDASFHVSGEFTIALRGETEVQSIFVGFNDKDLADRLY